MKFVKQDSNDVTLRKLLFLRYGTDAVARDKPPRALLSWMAASSLLKVPYARAMRLKARYFEPAKPDSKKCQTLQEDGPDRLSPVTATRVTCRNVRAEELEFLCPHVPAGDPRGRHW